MEVEEGVPLPPRAKGPGRCARWAKQRLPVLQWAPQYERSAALADLVAGITLGLTLVPQSIAYAALANLPVQYGLYSSFIGTMLYVLLGTVKEVSIGPTSLMALLTLQFCHGLPVQFVVLLTFLSGCIVFAMGLLRLGFLVDLISPAVTSGFTSATAVIIMVAQLKGLLGLSFVAETLYENLVLITQHIREVRVGDAILAAACCTVLLLLRKLKDLPVHPKRARLRKTLWVVSIGRNALVVCAASVLAYCTALPTGTTHPYFKLSGRVEPGLPLPAPPPFSAPGANGTTEVSFVHMVQRLGSGLLMLPIVMVLANIAIAKAFSGGARVDATQEMLTLGLCNMAGSLFHAMPTCGAFTRSAVSHSSGVRTPLAGLYSGIITLLALNFLTEYFFYIPKACLSSVLICAVMFMVDVSTVLVLWRSSRAELCVLGVTFCVGVCWSVELALLSGAAVSLARLLRALMRPRIHTALHKTGAGAAVCVRPALALVYVNAEHVAARAAGAAQRAPRCPLLLDCAQLSLLDHTAGQVLVRLKKQLEANGQALIPFSASGEALRRLETLQELDTCALRARTLSDALALHTHAHAHAHGHAHAHSEAAALLAPGPLPDSRADDAV